MFMAVALSAIGIAVVLMVGYIVVSQVRGAIPAPQTSYANSCFNHTPSSTTFCNTTAIHCGPTVDNTSLFLTCDDAAFTAGTGGIQTSIFAGLGLLAVGVIVLATFALIQVFNN